MEVSRFTINPKLTQYQPSDTTRMLLWLQQEDNLKLLDNTSVPKMVKESFIPGFSDKRKTNALLALRRSGLIDYERRPRLSFRDPKNYYICYQAKNMPQVVLADATEASKERSRKLGGIQVAQVATKVMQPQQKETKIVEKVEEVKEVKNETPTVEVPLSASDLLKGGLSLTLNINFTINK